MPSSISHEQIIAQCGITQGDINSNDVKLAMAQLTSLKIATNLYGLAVPMLKKTINY
jgi:hypothetical protein